MSCLCDYTIKVNTSHKIQWLGVSYKTNDGTIVYLNGSTIVWTLYDEDEVMVPGGTGNLTYIVGTDGNYEGIIPPAVTELLREDAIYYIEAVLTDGAVRDTRRDKVRAEYRKGSETI